METRKHKVKRDLVLFCTVVLYLASCQNLTPAQRDVKETIGQTLHIKFAEEVQHGGECLPMDAFMANYKSISVIYLQNGCAPCYPKFIEWQQRMGVMELPLGYTVLFVIQGTSYNQFMQEVNAYAKSELGSDTITNCFPVAMDPDFAFLSSNNQIPRWIIDRSVLIDQHNRIRMVGAPWASPEMTELFHRICSEE